MILQTLRCTDTTQVICYVLLILLFAASLPRQRTLSILQCQWRACSSCCRDGKGIHSKHIRGVIGIGLIVRARMCEGMFVCKSLHCAAAALPEAGVRPEPEVPGPSRRFSPSLILRVMCTRKVRERKSNELQGGHVMK